MKTIIYFQKRMVMMLIFILAIQTTIDHVTGASIQMLFKGALTSGTSKTASNEAIEAMQTIEKKIDFSKYPKHQVVATGYTAGYESTGKKPNSPSYGVTYSGVKVKRDLYSTVAADLDIFPVGTILWVPGYGYGVVADTGSAIKGNRLDLYYETVSDVYNQWGKKTIDVYIVKVGKGALSEAQLTKLNEAKDMQVFRQQLLGKIPE